MDNNRRCQVHWLLGTAVYPKSDKDRDLGVWSFLETFDGFLLQSSKGRDVLVKKLGLQCLNFPNFAVYLFDNFKHGVAQVENAETLAILMGNALIGLMQNDLALKFFRERNIDEREMRGSRYGSIGAAALVYDPSSLQAACANRCANQFLMDQILSAPSDGQAGIALFVQIEEKLGKAYNWLSKLTSKLPRPIGSVSLDTEKLFMSAVVSDFSLAELDYEHFDQTQWQAEIENYKSQFDQERLPGIKLAVDSNYQEFENQTVADLAVFLDHLPLDVNLYPGGIQNASQVLKLLSEYIKYLSTEIGKLSGQVAARQAAIAQKLTEQSQQLGNLIKHAPKLPFYLRILPGFVRKWLAPYFYIWRYSRQLYLIYSLQSECTELIGQFCGLSVELQALEKVGGIIPVLLEKLTNAETDLKEFEEKIRKTAESFALPWGEFPLAAKENGWLKLFRLPVADECLANWAYGHWLPNLSLWLQDFLGNDKLFVDWRAVEQEALAAWVSGQATHTYQPIWSLDLEKILQLWQAKTPGFVAPAPLSPDIIDTCMNVAVPPLRPNFDAVGGSGNSIVSFHRLTGKPEWKLCCQAQSPQSASRWQAIFTGDPYTAVFMQFQHEVPLNSLVDSFGFASRRMKALPLEQRKAYDLFLELEHESAPVPESTDPNDPDLIVKTFTWKFRPKGSSKERDYAIQLPISRKRYEYHRRLPRLNGQWNVYAQEEMPEVRILTSEFQKLHASEKWSTFNQAFNVLSFVQGCVPYKYDIDSTGYEDWARYPIETLMEGTGDCEDVAILCAAIIARLGFQVVLLLYPKHLAFGVAGADNLKGNYIHDPQTGLRYFYGEATAKGWILGQVPDEFKNVIPDTILPVKILIQE